jgi:S1-C subfamily serine protease
MSKRFLKIVAWVAALLLVLGVGAAIGGGIVYATTQDSESISFTFQPDGEKLFEPEPGIVIAAVVPDGPADEAGVVRGDILLQVDGKAVNDVVELMRVLEGHEDGDEVELAILHGDDERTLTATLGDRDDVAYLGVVPCAGVPVPGRRLTIHTAGPRATILDVVPDGPADRAGLQPGDVIVAVDEQELIWDHNLADVIAAYEPGDTVTLEVEQPGPEKESRQVTVELGEHPDREGVAYLGVQYRPSRPVRVLEDEFLPFHWQRHVPFMPGDLSLHIVPGGELVSEINLQGAIVRHVDEDSPAEAAGLREGDLITAIEGDPVEGPRDLADAIAERQPGDRVTLTVSRLDEDEGEEREVEVTLAEHPEEEGKAYLGVRIGGFIHIHRSGDKDHEFDLGFDFEVPLDDLHFEFDAPHFEFDDMPHHFEFDDMPHHFEFRFPHRHFEGDGTDCCGESI